MSSQGKVEDQSQQKIKTQQSFLTNNNFALLRGGLIGVAISTFVSWNAGRYSRVGAAFKRWKFARNFILINQKPLMPIVTNYYTPVLDTVMNNFFCFSGEAGIGKSYHFQNMSYTQSGIRPALYVAFKSSGRDATFEEDLAEQLDYGGDCPGILSEIIKAVKKIHEINIAPYRFWLKFMNINALLGAAIYFIGSSSLQATIGMALSTVLGASWIFYIYFMVPFLVQSLRRSVPLIIFDDLNKIEHLGMISEIVRFLQLLQNNMANVVLVSSDEQTWSKLRKQPGVKDRLRLRHIIYNHEHTANKLITIIDQNYEKFMKFISGNKHYQKDIVKSLVRQLIGRRQVTLRRFISILKLNDEEQYQQLIQVLKNQKSLTNGEIVQQFTDILYDSEMQTMVANLKTIKRQVMNMSDEQYFEQLKLLKKRGKLSSDNKLAPFLKSFNIVRDLRSQYVFNGRFMYTVFNMSILKYENDMKNFKTHEVKVQENSQNK